MRHEPMTAGAERLLSVPGMENLPRHTRAEIDALSTELRIPAGQLLIRQGNPGRQTFLITEGTAAVRCGEANVAVRSSGHIVGEAAVLLHCPRNADVVALTDLTVLVMSPAELASLCDDLAFRVWLDSQIGTHAASA
ncbi:MAG TPA: cyclic nucleotide-binding domain-containing protein [Mycobacteriales bacterium]|nr:cyclic nucleotide-binding domain-containing protein [Mycobacteriales bacterium]